MRRYVTVFSFFATLMIGEVRTSTEWGEGVTYEHVSDDPKVVNRTFVSTLQSVYIWNCGLKALPRSIVDLPVLTRLGLNDNELTCLPDEIGRMTTLEDLWIPENQLVSLPTTIGGLKNLRDIWLTRNRLSSLPSEVGQLNCLTKLKLEANELMGLPEELGGCLGLEELFLFLQQAMCFAS